MSAFLLNLFNHEVLRKFFSGTFHSHVCAAVKNGQFFCSTCSRFCLHSKSWVGLLTSCTDAAGFPRLREKTFHKKCSDYKKKGCLKGDLAKNREWKAVKICSTLFRLLTWFDSNAGVLVRWFKKDEQRISLEKVLNMKPLVIFSNTFSLSSLFYQGVVGKMHLSGFHSEKSYLCFLSSRFFGVLRFRSGWQNIFGLVLILWNSHAFMHSSDNPFFSSFSFNTWKAIYSILYIYIILNYTAIVHSQQNAFYFSDKHLSCVCACKFFTISWHYSFVQKSPVLTVCCSNQDTIIGMCEKRPHIWRRAYRHTPVSSVFSPSLSTYRSPKKRWDPSSHAENQKSVPPDKITTDWSGPNI